jgi:hypothetical protein
VATQAQSSDQDTLTRVLPRPKVLSVRGGVPLVSGADENCLLRTRGAACDETPCTPPVQKEPQTIRHGHGSDTTRSGPRRTDPLLEPPSANRAFLTQSNQSSSIKSSRRPRNAKTGPESGACSGAVFTSALSPVKPRRKSVSPAAIHICVFAGGAIGAMTQQALHHRLQCCALHRACDTNVPLARVTSIEPRTRWTHEGRPNRPRACNSGSTRIVNGKNRVEPASASRHDIEVVLSSRPASFNLRQ